jgi:hypothetical protein
MHLRKNLEVDMKHLGLAVRLVVVVVLSGTLGFLLTFRQAVHSQEYVWTPFTAQINEEHFTGVADRTPIVDHISFARRSNGSEATYVTMNSPDKKETGQVGSILDVGRNEEIALDSFTKTVKTFHDTPAEIARILVVKRCGTDVTRIGERSEMLGHMVVRIRRSNLFNNGITDTADKWVAPDLGCFDLSETYTTSEGPYNIKKVTSITIGEPSDEMFVAPSDYVERSPSEHATAYAARFPGSTLYSPEMAKRLDEKYYAHQ